MKRILYSLIVSLCLFIRPMVALAYYFEVGGIYYNIESKTDKTVAVTYGNSYSGDVVIPATVTYNSTTYRVTSIGYEAFRYCSGLTSITIPSSVTSIGSFAFNDCSGLTSIMVESGNTKYDSRNNCNAIIETASNKLIAGCKNTVIPTSVTSIGQCAFCGYSGLKSITIPSSVTSIGPQAFFGCSGLTSITIPSGVTSIAETAFSGCSGLTSITIPSSVTSIGYHAFGECHGLTSITIPSSVTNIGRGAFYGCRGLTSISIPSSVTSIDKLAFSGCSGLTSIKCEIVSPFSIADNTFSNSTYSSATLYVPAGAKAAYQATDGWKKFAHIVEMDDDVQSIETIERDDASVVSYDIMGRRIDQRSIPAGRPYVEGGRVKVVR